MMQKTHKPHFEFIAMMASLMSIVALAIDALLPAIPNIGIAINNTNPTDHQLLITMIFLGIGVGQLFFGPLSDWYGRKSMVYVGFLVFGLATFMCIFARSLEMMVVGRLLQGVGLSAHRTIAISIIRDSFKGDYMARVMSFVTAFFLLVPIVAPALGKLVLDAMGWQAVFYVHMILAVFLAIWFWKRQPETLKEEYKVPFSLTTFLHGFKELLRYRETVAFTLVSGLVTGAFLVYLSASQYIFEDQYGLREAFPYIFAGLALSIGISTLLNGTLVLRFGMRKLSFMAVLMFSIIALLYSFIFWNAPNPSILVFIGFLFAQFFCLGFMWGNFRSIAMEPIGHIAGIGAAINGFFSTIISVPIATFIGGYVQDTALPLFAGLAVCGLLSVLLFLWSQKGKGIMAARHY